MKRRTIAASVALAISAVAPAAHAAGDPGNFVLPNFGYFTYGDANSYALQVLSSVLGYTGTNGPFYVASSPGQISDLIVLATGADGNPVNTNFPPNMDNAFPTPTGVSGSTFFRTGGLTSPGTYPAPDPVPDGFPGDLANSWDTTLSALQTFLNGKAPVFFFNNNQTNSGATTNENLAAWAQVWITGPNGLVGVWDFTNHDSPYRSPGQTPPGGGVPYPLGNPGAYNATLGQGPTADANGTDYVLSGGRVCYVNTPNPGTIVPCSTPGATTVNNNLGANQAAYAVVFPEMNAILASLFQPGANLDGYAMHVDFRMGCDPTLTFSGNSIAAPVPGMENPGPCTGKDLNNGYEQLFLGRVTIVPDVPVPEPGTLALLSLSLLGLVGAGRARRNRS